MATPATELVAVACVVESSLVLASEWSRVLADYISPLFKRLEEAHAVGHQKKMFRVAFVTYATADTRPTPLLTKRFFVPFQSVVKELGEEPNKLGIGQTASGGSRGMAALEGLVAAVELFDILRASIEMKPPRLVSHILHIAASKADETRRPMWNRSIELNDVSWETLPAELNKRNINLSIIILRPNSQFSELHSSAATKGVISPWFEVKSPHTLLLAGFPLESKVPKRSAENQSSPDSKRAKVAQTPSEPSPKSSPNVANSSPALVSSTQPTSTTTPQPTSTTNPTQPPRTGTSSEQIILARLRSFEGEIHKLNNDLNVALEQGRADVEQIRKDRDSKLSMLKRFQQAMSNQPLLQHTRSSSQGQSPIPPGPGNTQIPSANPNLLDVPRGPQSRNSGLSTDVAGQMQKQIDNRGVRSLQPTMSQPIQSTQQNQSQTVPTSILVQQPQINSKSYWEGSLTWAGVDVATNERKELHTQVKLTCSNGNIMPETWPKNLTLTPSREPVTLQDLQFWAKRTKGNLCTFSPCAKNTDQQSNERHFRSLIELLAQKHLYALAAWPVPSGTRSDNLLIFPIINGGTSGLVGVAFPMTGIPEMPKPRAPDFAAQFQKLPPEQKKLVVARIRQQQQQRQQMQLQKQQQQQQPALYDLPSQNIRDSAYFASAANLQDILQTNSMQLTNAFGTSAGVSGPIIPAMSSQLVGSGGGFYHRTPSDNSTLQTGGVSNEMLQSFMHRNVDDSGGAGMT